MFESEKLIFCLVPSVPAQRKYIAEQPEPGFKLRGSASFINCNINPRFRLHKFAQDLQS